MLLLRESDQYPTLFLVFVNKFRRLCGMAGLCARENIDFLTKQLIISLTGFQVTILVIGCLDLNLA